VRHLTTGGKPGRGTAGSWTALALIVGSALTVLLAGCSSSPAAGSAGTSCGRTTTAAGVPVRIDVVKGTVDCAVVLRVEAAYAAAIRNGDLRGNGGGAPLAVDGWTCESYTAPQALETGQASECHTANAEVVAVLSLPSASASAAS
jgi:hypothetical protein